jgi:hypothetical protein
MYSGNENDEQNILRGEQNITDGDQDEADSHAVHQQQQHDRDEDGANDDMDDDGEDHGEDDEDQLIDIAGLEDHEKAILLQYLHDEYQKNPDQLPMPKEVVAQLLAENKDMVEGLDRHHELMPGQQQYPLAEEDEDQDEDQGEEQGDDDYGMDDNQDQMIQVQNNNAMVIEGEQNDSEERRGAEDEEKEDYLDDDQGEPQINAAPGGAADEEYEEAEEQQIFNPQYQLEDIQERDQDGNLIQHSLNVNTHGAQLNELNEQQYQMMLLQQQIAAQQ